MNAETEFLTESFVFGVIATLLTIITIIQTFRASRFAKKAALAQRVFQKPALQFDVYGYSDVEDFIIALPLGDKVLIEMPLTYTLHNRGEISAKEIEISVRMSKDLRYGNDWKLVAKGGETKNMKVAVASETQNLKTIVTTLESLHPEQHFAFSDLISIISSTILDSSVSLKTADNMDLALRYTLEFAYSIDFVVSQVNQGPIAKRISLSIIDTSKEPIKDYFDKHNQARLKEHRERLAELNFLARLKRFWSRVDQTKRIRLFIIEQTDLKDNEVRPSIYTLKVSSMKTCDGLKDAQGYFIPAINVFWPRN